jgi:phage terminase small subunit
MPSLAHHKHELFAQAKAKGQSNAVAYRGAGFNPRSDRDASGTGSKLCRMPEIAARIVELKSAQLKRHNITVDSLVVDLEKAFRLGMKTKQPAAAVGAKMSQAKLLGLYVEKAEIESTLRRPMREPGATANMTLDEWQAKFAPKPVLTPQTPPEGSA